MCFSLLVDLQDADIICQKINLCNSSSSEALVVKHVPTPLSATSLSVQCKICDFIAELIVIMMNSDNTKVHVHVHVGYKQYKYMGCTCTSKYKN